LFARRWQSNNWQFNGIGTKTNGVLLYLRVIYESREMKVVRGGGSKEAKLYIMSLRMKKQILGSIKFRVRQEEKNNNVGGGNQLYTIL
jgi:hypothetical protein